MPLIAKADEHAVLPTHLLIMLMIMTAKDILQLL